MNTPDRHDGGVATPKDTDDWPEERSAMVRQLRAYEIRDERMLAAMGKIRRHLFIPAPWRRRDAYGDHPCPIGHEATISQPFIIAYMTARLALQPGNKVLEIGTGSGYQAALQAELGMQVTTVERIPELAEHAAVVLRQEGYPQVRIRVGNGYAGWPEDGPFDAIIATCAADQIPPRLVDQLADNGRMILPVGTPDGVQRLVLVRKEGGRALCEDDIGVRFVPMVR
jgi:protein-L-isoaspartate(D-aspartate) O-methyltransferase